MDIILVEPENPGNIGAIARSMKNFGFERLVLINPCYVGVEARKRAKHALDILQSAEIFKSLDELEYDVLIGTTAKTGRDYNIPRSPIMPHELEEVKGKVGLVFGRESSGLTTEELKRIEFVVKIPVSPKYPTMNLSHAATILMYEFSKNKLASKLRDQHKFAGKKEKEVFRSELEELLAETSFRAEHERDTQRKVWKKLIGKSMLTQRELFALIGFIKKLQPKNSEKNSK